MKMFCYNHNAPSDNKFFLILLGALPHLANDLSGPIMDMLLQSHHHTDDRTVEHVICADMFLNRFAIGVSMDGLKKANIVVGQRKRIMKAVAGLVQPPPPIRL